MKWKMLNSQMREADLGYLPGFLSDENPAGAKVQIDQAYGHGGGWFPFQGFKLMPDNSLEYPGDPPNKPLAETTLRDELIIFYEGSWVAVIQKDRTFEVARID